MIFVSHDRHFISHLATAVLEVKGGEARYLPGDYDYYLRRTAQEAGAQPGADGRADEPAAAEARAATATQKERQEEKRLKSELRALEREEGVLIQQLEELEAARREIEESMALPEAYANGGRMKELRKKHEENHDRHAQSMARWEEVDSRIGALREGIEGLRSDKAAQ